MPDGAGAFLELITFGRFEVVGEEEAEFDAGSAF